MPVSTTDLMQKIYDVFSSAYAAHGNGAAFLAFEKLGVPLTDNMFKLQDTDPSPSPALACERLTEIAIRVIEAEADSVIRTSRNVDAMAELMLTEAMPLSPEQMAMLGAAKDSAKKAFDLELGSLDGLSRFHPVKASPPDWYVAANTANWISHTVGDHQQTGPTPPPPPAGSSLPPRHTLMMTAPAWRVMPATAHPAIGQPLVEAHPLLMTAAQHSFASAIIAPHQVTAAMAMRPVPVAQRPMALRQFATTTLVRPAFVSPPAAPVAHPPVRILRPLISAQASASIRAAATAQPVAAATVNLSFDHCIVTLQYPWFPQVFLMDRGWYIPGYAKGSFSNGTGNGDTGYLPVLAGGFVVIRNLKISGQWTNQDLAAVQGSAAFGPFSLIGRSYDAHTGTLSCPGMQIIGWFCEALPVLPPNSDPALSTATGPPAASTASPTSGSAASLSTASVTTPPAAQGFPTVPAATSTTAASSTTVASDASSLAPSPQPLAVAPIGSAPSAPVAAGSQASPEVAQPAQSTPAPTSSGSGSGTTQSS
jgi:hypothetical protein